MSLPASRLLELPADRHRVATVLTALAAINLVFVFGTLASGAWSGLDWRVGFALGQFNLARENNLGAWYSAMLLFGVALVMLLCHAIDRREAARSGEKHRWLVVGWLALAALFASLSLDELGSLHERLSRVRAITGPLPVLANARSWVAVLALPAAGIAVAIVAFGWMRVRRSRAAFLLMVGGIVLFVPVFLLEELENSMKAAAGPGAAFLTPTWLLAAEEGFEVFGMLLVLAAGLVFLRHRGGDRIAVEVGPRHLLVLAVLAAIGMAVAHLILARMINLADGRGIPQNWYPSVLALLAALAAAHVAGRKRSADPGGARALVVLGAANLFLAIDHGSAHSYTAWLFQNRPGVSLVRDLTVMVALLLCAAWVARAVRARALQAGVAAWVTLYAVSYLVVPGLRTVIAPAAYLSLLAGLLTLLPPAGDVPSLATAASPTGTSARR